MFRNGKLINLFLVLAVLLTLSATSQANSIYRFNGSIFAPVAGSLSQVLVGADGAAW